jgi:hypothetical protein
MAGTSHFGEIEDGKTYTHKRVASIMNVDTDWVKDRLLYPTDPSGHRIPGVPHAKVGALYFFSGEAIRLWIEQHASPDTPENDE